VEHLGDVAATKLLEQGLAQLESPWDYAN